MSFIINPYRFAVAGYDPDAEAFFTAAGITDTTEKNAVNQLVLDFKAYNIWANSLAIYPYVGGTAGTHKYNLKDPQDTDAAFRLTLSGGLTHSSTGMLPNGSNGYANTHLDPNAYLNLDDVHFSVYLRTNTNTTSCDMGAHDSGKQSGIFSRYAGNCYVRLNDFGSSIPLFSSSDSKGFYIANRVSSGGLRCNIQSTLYTNSEASTSLAAYPFYIGAISLSGTPSLYSDREVAFASIGDGLTDTEMANFATAVQTFQTALSRQV